VRVRLPRRRWLRRLAVGLVSLFVVVTAFSVVYNLWTNGDQKPATELYPGPFVRADGTLVAYRQWGSSGPPILLLGGFAEPTMVWKRVAPLLARHHRVVAIDLPPFGYTQRLGPYTLDAWIALARATAARLGLAHPLVVGHSLGAAVAAGWALASPGQVSGIVLLDGDALASGGSRGWLSHLLVNPYYTTLFRLATGSDWLFGQVLGRAYGPEGTPPGAPSIAQWQRPFRVEGTADALRTTAAHGIVGLQLADLAKVKVPSTVVWGAADSIDSVSAGRATARALGAPFILLPGAGHLSMLVDPTGVAAAVESAG
jgi:pimeloyl-ACP methyl ester carboxylesterase